MYIFNQYHTKSAISVLLLHKSAWLKCDIKLLQQFTKPQNVAELWKRIAFTWRKKSTLFFWMNELIILELWDNFSWKKSFCSVFLNCWVFEIIKSLIQNFSHEKWSRNSEIMNSLIQKNRVDCFFFKWMHYASVQNNNIWIKKNLCAKWVLSCHYTTFFSIKGSFELSKERYASYIEPQWTFFSKSLR